MLGNEEAARAGYEGSCRNFGRRIAGAAAYRLGEYLFAEKKYDPALIQFQLAAREAADDEVPLGEIQYRARSRASEATRGSDQILRRSRSGRKNNPYLQYALSLAENAASAEEGGSGGFAAIAEGSAPSSVRAEAAIKAAALAAGSTQTARAQAFRCRLSPPGKRGLEADRIPRSRSP